MINSRRDLNQQVGKTSSMNKLDFEYRGKGIKSYEFWRDIALWFCVFSLVGHWMEIGYCAIMDSLFGIVEDDSLVWEDPMYPFLVYGIGTAVCAIFLVPLKTRVLKNCKTMIGALILFYIITVVICMLMELDMGLLLNQPDEFGEYPLWDNSKLPGNIFGQAWIVNDILLGAVTTLYVWVVYPLCKLALSKLSTTFVNVLTIVVVISFTILCVVKFS